MRVRVGLVILGLACLASAGRAHFHILLPEKPSVKKGEEVAITLRFGHPFEHQLFDAPAPRSLVVLTPGGKKVDLTRKLEKGTVSGDKEKKVTAYRLRYTPEERGDHVFVLVSSPFYLEDDKEYAQDTVKVVLHVQAQKAWDVSSGDFEWSPLTRPYGLLPGMVFQARTRHRRSVKGEMVFAPVAGAMVEVERYNPKPPASLPPDEHVTRTVKTDPAGVVTTSLPEAGWWALTVARPGRQVLKKGDKEFKAKQRSTLWVHVDPRPESK
jgi:uncharacterized GH25 family protein